ncbi:MAG: M23 family metallopeptidase [Solirubrobacteraceae bacterium]
MLLLALAATTPAQAHKARSAGTGGASVAIPAVKAFKCGTGETSRCPRGSILRLSGEHLRSTRRVVFLGKRGRRDDRRARPRSASPHRVLVKVPSSARSGRLRVILADGSANSPRLRVLPKPVPPPIEPLAGPLASAFPVQGEHDYGTRVNGFGGGRGHQGQDVLADCGTPLVAAVAGTVTNNASQSRAGNYVVIQADNGVSQAYMHMRRRAIVKKGDVVAAGQPLGEVGQTGRASACHLHFELWTAPGWHSGGSPVDPLPLLKALEKGTPKPN